MRGQKSKTKLIEVEEPELLTVLITHCLSTDKTSLQFFFIHEEALDIGQNVANKLGDDGVVSWCRVVDGQNVFEQDSMTIEPRRHLWIVK